jgi:hypothetical protein
MESKEKQDPTIVASSGIDQEAPTCKGNWRAFFISINLLRVLQKLTKRKTNRILAMVQWKASAVLKRVSKVQNVPLQLYALKVMKSLVPYLGRKWRGSRYFWICRLAYT